MSDRRFSVISDKWQVIDVHELNCPHCGKVFKVDATDYDSIVAQVRNAEFERELQRRSDADKAYMKSVKDAELRAVKADAEAARVREREAAAKDLEKANAEIARLKSDLASADANAEKKHAAARDDLLAKVHAAEIAAEKAKAEATAQVSEVERNEAAKREAISLELANAKAENIRLHDQMNIEKERGKLDVIAAVQAQRQEDDAKLLSVKSDLEHKLMETTTQLDYYKDLKTRMSTKMVGETLEQHCMVQFNQIRSTAFPKAYFEKDNDASSGSKGDFIYREEMDGVELISIMFEMKNEMDTTATKHRNEDFFKELNKDRNEKKCEYAILVSMLEADSELYNNGIVDVSYRFPKMYVIRPQFFIPIISILRNAALNAMDARRELVRTRNMNIDVAHFEEALMTFHAQMEKNYNTASSQFQSAISGIDKVIDSLQKIRQNLLSSERNLRLMDSKARDMTIQRLTRDAPSVRDLFNANLTV